MAQNGDYISSKGMGSQHNGAYGKHASENEKHRYVTKMCVGGEVIFHPPGRKAVSPDSYSLPWGR